MAWTLRKGDGVNVVVLILAVVAAAQAVKYWAQVASVDKVLTAQLMVFQQSGTVAYREAVLGELAGMDLEISPDDLDTVEDRAKDELCVELRYEWPLHVLVFTLPRSHVARTRTTILEG